MATIADVEDDYGAGGGSASVQRDGGPERVADVDMEEEVPEGVIYPPREIRAVVDKTAQFVARSGPQFEERIRENERANPKFSFLNPRDPFHAYYLYKIRLTREGRGGDAALGDTPAQRPGGAAQKEKPVPKEPPAFEFSIDLPPISAQDLDVLLHTAQFTARNGRQFLTSLAQREAKNPQFDFLRPNHSFFPYFTKMVEQYTKVLVPSQHLTAKLEENKEDVFKILDRVMVRVEWKLYEEEKKRKREEEEDAERIAFAEIDWHDFVVVETVEFTETDDLLPLPSPSNKADLQTMSLAQRNAALMVNTDAGQFNHLEDQGEGEMEVEMDEDDGDQPAPKAAPAPAAPPMMPPTMPGFPPGMPMPGFPPGMPMPPGFGMPPQAGFPQPGFPPGYPMPPGMVPGAFPMPGMPPMPVMPQVDTPKPAHERDEEAEEGDSKRQKVDIDTFTLKIETASVPDRAADWGLNGSTIDVPGIHGGMNIGQVKDRIQQILKMPANRQKLSTDSGVVLKNTATVASYQFKEGDRLMLDVRAK